MKPENHLTRGHLAAFAISTLIALATSTHAGVWAHYPFDADFTDTSGNAQHATLTDVGTPANSGITATPGEFKFGGGAMNFSADRDFLAVPSKTFGSASPYSIAFWAKKAPGDTGGSAQWDMVIGQRDNANFFVSLNDATGTGGRTGIRWRSNSSVTERQADSTAPDDTSWHHYVVTADNLQNVKFYLDGKYISTGSGKLTGFIFDTIGEAYNAANDFDFHGLLDELWIFDETLDPVQVSALYLSNDASATPSLSAFHHRYDGDLTDSGPAGNDGIANGTAATTSDPAKVVKGSGALSLDGADASYLTLAQPGAFASNEPWTITWWARRDADGIGIGIQKGMVMGRAGNTTDFIWQNENFTGLRFRSSNSTTHDFNVTQDSQLRHYALVADGAGDLSLYLDGQFSESATGDTSFTVDSIGSAYPTNTLKYNFKGTLDEVHVIDTAYTATQINDLYNDEKPTPPGPIVDRVRVFLLGGQSNADGRAAATSALPTSPVNLQIPQDDIDLYYKVQGSASALTTLRPGLSETGQFGPEITLGRRLADIFGQGPETRTAIVKYANGGTNLQTQWTAGGDATTTGDGPDYLVFQQTVTDGLAALAAAYPGAIIEIEGMAWLQGESDITSGFHNSYQANLTAFIADIRATYGAELPFTIIRLSDNQTALDSARLTIVQAAMDAVAAADPRTGIINTDTYSVNVDNLHFDEAGQQAIGYATGEQLAYFRWMTETFSSAAITAGNAEPAADADGDQQNNLDEWIAGTLADDSLSVFRATISLTPPDQIQIEYPANATRMFSIDRYNSTLNSWSEFLPDQIGTGTTDTRDFTSTDPGNIYRVRAKIP